MIAPRVINTTTERSIRDIWAPKTQQAVLTALLAIGLLLTGIMAAMAGCRSAVPDGAVGIGSLSGGRGGVGEYPDWCLPLHGTALVVRGDQAGCFSVRGRGSAQDGMDATKNS